MEKGLFVLKKLVMKICCKCLQFNQNLILLVTAICKLVICK